MKKRGNRFIDRAGERHLNYQGCWMTIIAYRGALDCDIEFDNRYQVTQTVYDSVKRGSIKNHYHPSVFGVGYFGVGRHKSKIDGKFTNTYNRWVSMLGRCYNIKFHSQHTYKEITVCKEWKCFQVFAEWYENNYKSHMQDWQLDKDILIKGNKIYSPETCCFVPSDINSLFIRKQNHRGKYPVGVYYNRKDKKFVAQLAATEFYKRFDTPEEAFQAYKIEKERYIKEMADKWRPYIIKACYEAMYNYVVEITD